MKKILIVAMLCMALVATMAPAAAAADTNYAQCMAAIQEQKTIQAQAHKTDTTEQLRQYVAQVVLNRVKDSRFPSTVKAVITQPGQYATKYADASTTQSVKSKDAANGTYYYAMCENAVKTAMMGQVNMPSNVLYQANFSQGMGVWKSVSFNSGWYSSTSYFCYG